MTTISYILAYPFLWGGLLSVGLALCRMRASRHMIQMLVAIILLSIMSVIVQYYEKAYLFGILHPISLTICFRMIFKLRPFHAILISVIIFANAVISEILYNILTAGFHIETALFYQQNDYLISCLFMALHQWCLYYILQRFRIGFSFIAPSAGNDLKRLSFSRTWFILALGLLLFLGMFNLSVYFTNHLLLPIIISFTVCWTIVLFLSYRKELEDN
ncbi:hypothetical protein [Paenibacillus puerhi]|uniref:hypothetical protein n=1 Tax=Paenibacillus puerhi TaxID=2692622 RepID=UPI00135CF694|nr:hypothetical protein [Paenibacillus puerhi]